jgi:A/G-specific adenine glycosylase
MHTFLSIPGMSQPLIRGFRKQLLAWYDRTARDLPWRKNTEPYRVWISEIMLQQTQVETVKPYYHRFLIAFPDVQSLAAAPEQQVLKLWEGLGYYRRARQLQAAAKIIAGDLSGRFPQAAESWMRLPGIGRYSAGAIASIAFGEAVPVVDGNVKRVLARFFALRKNVDDPGVVKTLWGIAGRLVPGRRPGDFNQAMMELGACVCLPRQPDCPACPVRRSCQGLRQGQPEQLPVRRVKKKTPHYEMAGAVVCRAGRVLLLRRPVEGLLGGLWEFPNARLARLESREEALARMLRSQTGLTFRVAQPLTMVRHAFSHFSITLHAYLCTGIAGRVAVPGHPASQWVRPEAFKELALSAAQKKIAEALKREFEKGFHRQDAKTPRKRK